MTISNFPNGLGSTLGDTLGTCKPLATAGTVWFVYSVTGSDSYGGGDATKPRATIASAYSAASAGDIIVCLSGHTETLTGAQTLGKAGLTIVGLGSSGGLPTVKLTLNASSGNLFTVTAAATALRNVWIKSNAQTNSTARITVTGAGFRMGDCHVECSATDTGPAVALGSGADGARFIDSTFVSTATSIAAQPLCAINTSSAIADLELDGLVLDAGAAGFSGFYALDLSFAAVTRLRGENITLSGGADVTIASSSTGYINAQTVDGTGKLYW